MEEIIEGSIKITPNGILVQKDNEVSNRHTEDIQEIITKVPSWIVRWGITLLFSVLLIMVAISVLVRYPDMVKMPVKLLSSGNASSVVANAPGVITKVFVKKDQLVKNGQALVEIQNTINKQLYILKAPQDGIAGFSAIVQPGSFILSDQEVFRIHSHNEQYFAVVQIAQSNISKIKEGQDVLINLSNYPSEQYGPLKGKIDYVANEPAKNGFFVAKVTFNNNADAYKNIRLGSWMTGEAQVITEDVSLQSRILNSITKGIR
jgi:multidrug efflux pump subunit AcrA (membrane-fusion protein)